MAALRSRVYESGPDTEDDLPPQLAKKDEEIEEDDARPRPD